MFDKEIMAEALGFYFRSLYYGFERLFLKGEAELEILLEPIDDITIPYGLTLEALRKELEPYLPKRVEG